MLECLPNLIDRRCDLIANPRSNNRFIQRGRWGIPVTPNQVVQDSPFYADLGPDEVLTDELFPTQPVLSTQVESAANSPPSILEAQQWSINAHGKVQLLAAQPVKLSPHKPTCQPHRDATQGVQS